ncbi:MAG: hypothetical protein M1568_03935 [Acidobacteria bacterium]|nr:hypothetical protein [Acidobacteriota bacterium]
MRIRRSFFATLVAAALVLSTASLHAQVVATAPVTVSPAYNNHFDVFGGYMYSHFNPARGDQIHAINMLGVNGTFTDWVKPSFGFEFTTRHVFGTILPPVNGYGIKNYRASQHFFMVGVASRFVRHPKYDFGMHLDVGAVYGIFNNGYPAYVQPIDLGIFNTQPAIAMAIGAFYDYNIKPKWAIRLYTDWQPTFYGKTHQDEFAGALGIVYKFGKRKIK